MGRKTKATNTHEHDVVIEDDDEANVLVDLTKPLKLTSKRTKRQQLKMQKRKVPFMPRHFIDLDVDSMRCILEFCTPSSIWALSKVCRGLRLLIRANEAYLIKRIIAFRYPNISRSFRLPHLMTEVAETFQDKEIMRALATFNKEVLPQRVQLRHIPRHPAGITCSCTTCVDRWLMLCLAVDFAHWQDDLDDGKPLPRHEWGVHPSWERKLRDHCRQKIIDALHRPLMYAMILESHLDSTIRAIQRQRQNKTNQSRHFPMTAQEATSGTDHFLSKEGPNNVEYPYSRELYYMLEVFLPGRAWNKKDKEWRYLVVQHDQDLRYVMLQVQAYLGP